MGSSLLCTKRHNRWQHYRKSINLGKQARHVFSLQSWLSLYAYTVEQWYPQTPQAERKVELSGKKFSSYATCLLAMTTDRQLDRLLVDYLAVESRVQEQLPFILEAITSQGLLRLTQQDDNEPTRRKWIARLNTLLQSKNARTRWAALSLIKLTCEESTDWAVAAALSWHNQLLTLVGVKFKRTIKSGKEKLMQINKETRTFDGPGSSDPDALLSLLENARQTGT